MKHHTLWQASTVDAARLLLGWELRRTLPGGEIIRGRITETEAYLQDDPASHTFKGQTPRNAAMFGPPGSAYVYFTYGMHFCVNIVTQAAGTGEAVLLRSLSIREGEEVALANRGGKLPIAQGPARLCQALAIDKSLNCHDLMKPPLELIPGGLEPGESIKTAKRIGISRGTDSLYRFFVDPLTNS